MMCNMVAGGNNLVKHWGAASGFPVYEQPTSDGTNPGMADRD